MPADTPSALRSARERIPVPDVPIGAILRRSRAARTRGRVQVLAACAALGLGAAAAGTGLGAKLYDGARVWLSDGDVALSLDSFEMVRQPTSADLRAAIAHATFPVVLPVGVPNGARPFLLTVTPPGRPSAVFLSYHSRTGGDGPSFVLLDPAAVERDGNALHAASAPMGPAYEWRAGGEIVLAAKRFVSQRDADRMRAAMATASPSDGFAAIEPVLAKVIVLGGPNRLELAERNRPPLGPGVLIDELQARAVAWRALRGEPILDGRTFRATHVPYANGGMDYAKIKGSSPKAVAIPAGGVRAIDAVLRSASARSGGRSCRCEVLFGRLDRATYFVATIPMTGAPPVAKYAVDAKTLAVKPIR